MDIAATRLIALHKNKGKSVVACLKSRTDYAQLFTKEQIFEAVWHQDSESCLTAVTNTIGRIRQKIEDDRAAPVYIRTISNLGYQFMPNISVKKDSL